MPPLTDAIYAELLHISDDDLIALAAYYNISLHNDREQLLSILVSALSKKHFRTGKMFRKLVNIASNTISSAASGLTSGLEKVSTTASSLYSNMGFTYGLNNNIANNDPNIDLLADFGYTAKKEIGSGAFGIVYLAEKDGKLFAVKVMSSANRKVNCDNEKNILELVTAAASHIGCNYSVCLRGQMERGDKYILVIDYIDGPTLTTYIESLSNRAIIAPAQKRYWIMLSMAKAVDAIHDLRIAHRDLKPGNTSVVTSDNPNEPYVKLLDFGMSCSYNVDKTQMYHCNRVQPGQGTESYMAPEVYNARPATLDYYKVDVFATGCTFYKIITGTTLFPSTKPPTPKTQDHVNLSLAKFSRQKILHDLLADMLFTNPGRRSPIKEIVRTLETRQKDITRELQEIDALSMPGFGYVNIIDTSYHGNKLPTPPCSIIDNTGASCADSAFEPVV